MVAMMVVETIITTEVEGIWIEIWVVIRLVVGVVIESRVIKGNNMIQDRAPHRGASQLSHTDFRYP
jgi:hypothetical protein